MEDLGIDQKLLIPKQTKPMREVAGSYTYFADGDVHKYFSPYESPYEAHIAFSNALCDLALRAGQPGWRPPHEA